MKNVKVGTVFAIAILLLVLSITSCVSGPLFPPQVRPLREAVVMLPSLPSPAPAPLPSGSNAPGAIISTGRATIAFQEVEGLNLISVGWGGVGAGPEINTVFADELAATGRFRVVGRGQTLKTIMGEQDLSSSGRVNPQTAVKSGVITGARFLARPKITDFSPGYDSKQAFLAAVANLSSNVWLRLGGAIAGGIRRSRLEITVQVFDAETTDLVFTQPFEADSTDWNLGGGLGIGGLGGGVAGGASSWTGTPLGVALRALAKDAVASVAKEVNAGRFPDHFKY